MGDPGRPVPERARPISPSQAHPLGHALGRHEDQGRVYPHRVWLEVDDRAVLTRPTRGLAAASPDRKVACGATIVQPLWKPLRVPVPSPPHAPAPPSLWKYAKVYACVRRPFVLLGRI